MENRQKEIIWTIRSMNDLKRIYKFNCSILKEAKSFSIIECIISDVGVLEKGFENIGSKYESRKHPNRNYRKIISSYHIIIYRIEKKIIYIHKVFDTRQNPSKLKV